MYRDLEELIFRWEGHEPEDEGDDPYLCYRCFGEGYWLMSGIVRLCADCGGRD
jgi:hypothetical protein